MNNVEGLNLIVAKTGEVDAKINNLMNSILDDVESLDTDISIPTKAKILVATEFKFFKLRSIVEFEHTKIKNILMCGDIDSIYSLKITFTKRDNYLAQLSMKLTVLREDINALQKLLYLTSNITRI